MEPKKNPKYDVHNMRTLIFNVSLIASLLIVIAAFKITAPIKGDVAEKKTLDEPILFVDVPKVTTHKKNEASRKKIKMTRITPTFVEVKNVGIEIPDSNQPFDEPSADTTFISIDVPKETRDEIIYDLVEKMPEHEGGLQSFYDILKKNIKYPKRANRLGTEGKVFVEFVINEKGDLTDFKIVKSVGDGCDEEAIRVLKLTKWKPGKQRGRPVKVRMVQPIIFKLSR